MCEVYSGKNESIVTRAQTMSKLVEPGLSDLTIKTCISDATRSWNFAPNEVKNSPSIIKAKKNIKAFAKTFP